jgi:hypothetical protein
MFDGLEQVDERVIAGSDALGRLVRFDVTKVPTWALENDTYSK